LYTSAGASCSFQVLANGLFPTLALILLLLTPFIFGLAIIIVVAGYFMQKKQNPDTKMNIRDFKSLHSVMKIGLVSLILAVLAPVIGVLLIVITLILNIVMGTGCVTS
jgi:uncharacterized membrane protein